ncbi:MAG: DUF2974 domain-containing protein [Ruminococcus sp.]|nr:DUF2974 domain-containing protein [Ruminococcus sp.]
MAGLTSDMDISLALDTLMYSDALGADKYKDQSVKDIVNDLYYNGMDGLKDNGCRAAVVAAKQYLDSPKGDEFGSLIMHSCSDQSGYSASDGAKGAAFYRKDGDNVTDVYVAYRGTGEGRWYDNGDAFDKKYSPYQQDAAEYFDSVMSSLNVDESANVIVTGHSKGGNEAQFVTLASKYAYLVDKCDSFDGQGFSPEAIAYFKQLYGEDFYEKQRGKMYSICGDNDFVNVLGIKVVPDENTIYIKTTCDTYDAANSHGLVRTPEGDNIDWKNIRVEGNLYDYGGDGFNETTKYQRDLAVLAKSLSENIMKLPPEEREDVCRSIMTILEDTIGQGHGLHGEGASLEEYIGLIKRSPALFKEILFTWNGQKFIHSTITDLLRKYVFQIDNREDSNIFVDIICNVAAGFIQYGLEGLGFVIYEFVSFVSKLAEFGEKLYKVLEFIANVAESIKNNIKKLIDPNYRAAQNYIKNENTLRFHTDDLRSLAGRLWAVNGRLGDLDSRIDGLYWKVKWTDLWNLMSSDLKICWSTKLNACANCLNDTADRFDNAEQQLLGMMG